MKQKTADESSAITDELRKIKLMLLDLSQRVAKVEKNEPGGFARDSA
jgi:hypothetical protein